MRAAVSEGGKTMNTTPKSNRLEYLDEMFRDERLGKLIDDIVA